MEYLEWTVERWIVLQEVQRELNGDQYQSRVCVLGMELESGRD